MTQFRVAYMWGFILHVPQVTREGGGKDDLIIEAESMGEAVKKLKEDHVLPVNGMLDGDPSMVMINPMPTNVTSLYKWDDLSPVNMFDAFTTGEI